MESTEATSTKGMINVKKVVQKREKSNSVISSDFDPNNRAAAGSAIHFRKRLCCDGTQNNNYLIYVLGNMTRQRKNSNQTSTLWTKSFIPTISIHGHFAWIDRINVVRSTKSIGHSRVSVNRDTHFKRGNSISHLGRLAIISRGKRYIASLRSILVTCRIVASSLWSGATSGSIQSSELDTNDISRENSICLRRSEMGSNVSFNALKSK